MCGKGEPSSGILVVLLAMQVRCVKIEGIFGSILDFRF